MIGVKTTAEFYAKDIERAAEKAQFNNFAHAAASISKDVKSTLEKADEPSAPGAPPHTHRGAYLRRAVRWSADKESAVIGPQFSTVGEAGAVHEFGEEFHGTDYPERPYMQPALERAIPRFADSWAGSIG